MTEFLDAFISYGRADSKEFATKLHRRLTELNWKIWFDQNDIPLAVDFQDQINEGINKSDNFLFIIAPHAVNSPYCAKEIDLAIQRNKRIIPILHVEQITQETWQQRYPTRSVSEWETYTAKGLHSSFNNLNPTIAKINWIYCREGSDDFETAIAGLTSVLERHRNYVQQHTYFLTKALEWERHHKQSHYLLIGEERQQAEAWLQVRFREEQPPCIASDLHCEFISESSKNAQNLMTQVFLSHAEEDDVISVQVSKSLMRQGLTVWRSKTDIQTGAEFRDAIGRGIEEADNVIYLLSPASLRSQYCQWEIEYALSLNKRIIPLLVQEVDSEQVPVSLRSLQYIDLADNLLETDYRHDESQLLRILQQDAYYYEQHKLLLTKALKWQRQNRNSSLLLRGSNLGYAEAWLTIAQQHPHPATPPQVEFITESLQQPAGTALDVFISYSRADSDFARRLNSSLQNQGKRTWFDQESIAPGTDFQQEIFAGIEISNHFLFVISPNSIRSPYCTTEVDYAKKLSKRIVTILHCPIDTSELHPVLAGVQWIDFHKRRDDFYTNLGELIRTLDTDQDYKRSHTRLLMRAMEWEQQGYDSSFLLYGKDLIASEQWLKQAAKKTPPAAALQLKYIQTSRKSPLPQARPRTVVLASLAATLFVVGIRSLGLMQSQELRAFDYLMRLRPSEPPDRRILIVEVTEEDLQNQVKRRERGLGTLSDESLNRLLQKLEQYQPRVIGLDFYRDFTADPAVPELADRLRRANRLTGVCKLPIFGSDRAVVHKGIAAPPEFPAERVAFSDVLLDSDDKIRRSLVRVVPPKTALCQASQGFGFSLALRYLEQQPGPPIPYTDPVKSKGTLRLGTVVFQRLERSAGGYQGINAAGYQLLLNYRTPNGNPAEVADRVTLSQLLNDQVPPAIAQSWKDRLVLVGTTSEVAARDSLTTPYRPVPGVTVQAQMASQILSSVLDGRLMLRVLPLWADILWIGAWALVGGGIVYCLRSPLRLGLVAIGAIASLYLVCFVGLIGGGLWLLLVPAGLAGILAGTGVFLVTARFPPQANSQNHRRSRT